MALSWIRSRKIGDVDSLVARGRYAKAVKVLGAEFEDRQPTPGERLRYADLLVLASRGGEAVPILLGVAEEQARGGFQDKAMEALRRAEEIDPDHPKVGWLHMFRSATASDRPSDPSASGSADACDRGPALDGALAPAAEPARLSRDAAGPPPESRECAPRGEGPGTVWVVSEADDDEPWVPEEDLESTERVLDPAEDELEPAEDDDLQLVLSESEAVPEAAPPSLAGTATSAADEASLHRFLLALGRTPGTGPAALGPALFARFPREAVPCVMAGVRRRRFAPGDVLVAEGDPGTSLFLIARGSVRVLVLGGRGQPFDVRRLGAGDFFGEAAVLSRRPRTATVVATTSGETLEIGAEALEALLALRPRARKTLEGTRTSRAPRTEEGAVRALAPETADPDRAADVLRAHFGRSEWSLRVRLHFVQLMLDAGRREEALAILASVTEDLARSGHAQRAIAVLKKVEWVRRRGVPTVPVAPMRKGRRRRGRARAEAWAALPKSPAGAPAVAGAAFREWVGSLLRVTQDLAARPAPLRGDPEARRLRAGTADSPGTRRSVA
jgi:CRP-like cAMP-binding protein